MPSNKRYAAKRDLNEAEIVQVLEAAGASVQRLSEPGVPDLLVGFHGENYLMEVKGPKAKLTDAETAFFQAWQGHKVIIRTPQEALDAIGR